MWENPEAQIPKQVLQTYKNNNNQIMCTMLSFKDETFFEKINAFYRLKQNFECGLWEAVCIPRINGSN